MTTKSVKPKEIKKVGDDSVNEKAVEAFMDKRVEALELLEEIEAELDDHMGMNLEKINWGHVGDATYILENLRDVARFMGHMVNQWKEMR